MKRRARERRREAFPGCFSSSLPTSELLADAVKVSSANADVFPAIALSAKPEIRLRLQSRGVRDQGSSSEKVK